MDSKWKVAVSRRSYPNGSNFEWLAGKSSEFRRALVRIFGGSALEFFREIFFHRFFTNFQGKSGKFFKEIYFTKFSKNFKFYFAFQEKLAHIYRLFQLAPPSDFTMTMSSYVSNESNSRKTPGFSRLNLNLKVLWLRGLFAGPFWVSNTLSCSHSPPPKWKCEQPFGTISRFNVDVPGARPERMSSKTRQKTNNE